MEGIINIAGVMPRIGTTTQALQLARYIKACSDYKVAYIECNSQNYIWSASGMYAATRDSTGGYVNIEGIDLYTQARMSELTQGGVDIDFLICDYGDLLAASFDRTAFMQGSVRVLTAGVKPNELHYTESTLRAQEYNDAVYIFTHVPPADVEEITGLMGTHAEDTFFSPYIPDPFQQMTEDKLPYYEKLMPRILQKIEKR